MLSGMWCASCGWLIEHALSRLTGALLRRNVLFTQSTC